jgi:hypothetical protein
MTTVNAMAVTTGIRNGQRIYREVPVEVAYARVEDEEFVSADAATGCPAQSRIFVRRQYRSGSAVAPMLIVQGSLRAAGGAADRGLVRLSDPSGDEVTA